MVIFDSVEALLLRARDERGRRTWQKPSTFPKATGDLPRAGLAGGAQGTGEHIIAGAEGIFVFGISARSFINRGSKGRRDPG